MSRISPKCELHRSLEKYRVDRAAVPAGRVIRVLPIADFQWRVGRLCVQQHGCNLVGTFPVGGAGWPAVSSLPVYGKVSSTGIHTVRQLRSKRHVGWTVVAREYPLDLDAILDLLRAEAGQ